MSPKRFSGKPVPLGGGPSGMRRAFYRLAELSPAEPPTLGCQGAAPVYHRGGSGASSAA